MGVSDALTPDFLWAEFTVDIGPKPEPIPLWIVTK